jgi:hypothetical protein
MAAIRWGAVLMPLGSSWRVLNSEGVRRWATCWSRWARCCLVIAQERVALALVPDDATENTAFGHQVRKEPRCCKARHRRGGAAGAISLASGEAKAPFFFRRRRTGRNKTARAIPAEESAVRSGRPQVAARADCAVRSFRRGQTITINIDEAVFHPDPLPCDRLSTNGFMPPPDPRRMVAER